MGSVGTNLSAFVLVFALCLRFAESADAGELVGIPDIISGDEIELAGQRLRLAEIDAPELGQMCTFRDRLYSCGEIARAALLDLTAGVKVSCRTLGPGPRGTKFARCFAQGYDLSEGMVYTGWALAEPGAAQDYGRKQAEAERKRHGLWRGRFVAPWDWTHGQRLPEESPGE